MVTPFHWIFTVCLSHSDCETWWPVRQWLVISDGDTVSLYNHCVLGVWLWDILAGDLWWRQDFTGYSLCAWSYSDCETVVGDLWWRHWFTGYSLCASNWWDTAVTSCSSWHHFSGHSLCAWSMTATGDIWWQHHFSGHSLCAWSMAVTGDIWWQHHFSGHSLCAWSVAATGDIWWQQHFSGHLLCAWSIVGAVRHDSHWWFLMAWQRPVILHHNMLVDSCPVCET